MLSRIGPVNGKTIRERKNQRNSRGILAFRSIRSATTPGSESIDSNSPEDEMRWRSSFSARHANFLERNPARQRPSFTASERLIARATRQNHKVVTFL
jgi:hypothetical protein